MLPINPRRYFLILVLATIILTLGILIVDSLANLFCRLLAEPYP